MIAHHAKEANLGGGHQLHHSVEHAETCAKDRDDEGLGVDEFDDRAVGHRGRDLDRLYLEIIGGLVCQEGHELLCQQSEGGRRGVGLSELAELVGDEGMIDHECAHGARVTVRSRSCTSW